MRSRLLLLLSLGLLWSCELVVEVDLPTTEPTLVLNSFAEAGQPWAAYLTPLLPATSRFEVYEQRVTDGTIEVFKDGTRLTALTFRENAIDAPYQRATMDFYGASAPLAEAGATYTIRASAPGYPPVEAETTIPRPASFDTLRTRYLPSAEPYAAGTVRADLHLTDHPGEATYFFLALQFEAEGQRFNRWFRLSNAPFQAVTAFEDNEIGGLFFSDATFRDGDVQFTIEADLSFGEVPAIVLYTVNEAYYRYHTTQEEQQQVGENPFAEAVPVYSNVQNGYGVFGGLAAAAPIRINPFPLTQAQLAGTYEAQTFFYQPSPRADSIVPLLDQPSDFTLTFTPSGQVDGTLRLRPDQWPLLPEGFDGTFSGRYTIDRALNRVLLDVPALPALDAPFRYEACGPNCRILRTDTDLNRFPRTWLDFISFDFR